MAKKELDKVYSPVEVEKKWLDFWLDSGIYKADPNNPGEPFTMVIPPPNITGTLHLGHALNNTLQDVMSRYKRMDGYNVLWVPGIDHAGIATQNVVEKQLHAEGTDRHTLGREKFIERVWKWKEESGGAIVNQLKRLGSSVDWSRERFTMDEGLSKSVKEVFVSLYNEGLIHRGNYIINWCPRCLTALSDIEVEKNETNGHLYHMNYPIKGSDKHLTVATTRPETMLGDTAVAVNPNDDRYKDLIGSEVELPLTNRTIPIIADDHVDMEFGTGAVKITPSHDFNDFDMGKKHNLEFITIMNLNATMNENSGDYEGQDRYKARKAVIKDLKEKGLLEKIIDHKLFLGKCYRCDTTVEPTLSKQWFVKVDPLARPAIEAVKNGDIKFVPKNWENTYFDWMNNIRDWCISRQIWWGHRIPAWYCEQCDHITVTTGTPKVCGKCSSPEINQETDVLDTWFSSALWPFSTLGWPEETPDLKKYYPTTVLFTSFDIIFFWVARMVMMGLKFQKAIPFKEVYIHALIRDSEGAKMSKSKGNVIDPLVMTDKYGTDSLRFTLAVLAAQGRDIKLAEDRIEGYRNFTNKLWNLARFSLQFIEKDLPLPDENKLQMCDKWILSKLNEATKDVRYGFDTYKFDESAKATYRFIWHELCDWYVELTKEDLHGDSGEERKAIATAVLLHCLRETLKLLHPFMPFVTEEIYSFLPQTKKTETISTEKFPSNIENIYKEETESMEAVMEVIRTVRNIRMENNIPNKTKCSCNTFTKDKTIHKALKDGEGYIKTLAKVDSLTIDQGEKSDKAAFQIAGSVEVFVPLGGIVDTSAEIEKLEIELKKIGDEIQGKEKKLSNKNFTDRAPAEIIEKEQTKLAGYKEDKVKIEEGIKRLQSL